MKYTIFVTQQCNLACGYCYVDKSNSKMSIPTAEKVVDFIYRDASSIPKIQIGLFGGEPLLEFDLVKSIVEIIAKHPTFDPCRVEISLVTNGTIFSSEIADFLLQNEISFCLSCDGPSITQDRFRHFPDGRVTSDIVERTILEAQHAFVSVLVNAVYRPETFRYLPLTVDYFHSLGLRQIYLNPDCSASWSGRDAEALARIYREVAGKYIGYYLSGEPAFINLIDNKIAVILRGGYRASERCQMGNHELAFSPAGNIYPCERLVGDGGAGGHCIGNIHDGVDISRMSCHLIPDQETNPECLLCGLKDYCMNWCGCSNYFASGYYNLASPFICHSEKASIRVAFDVFRFLEKRIGAGFHEHVSGLPMINSMMKIP